VNNMKAIAAKEHKERKMAHYPKKAVGYAMSLLHL